MQRLVDIFDTKYFPYHYTQDLSHFFMTALRCVNNSKADVVSDVPGVHKAISDFRASGVIEIDLAEAHFVPETMSIVLDNVTKGVIIFDSQNVYRDDIINENRRRMSLDYNTAVLPTIKDINDLPNFINDLELGIVYTIQSPSRLNIALATLVTIFRPEVHLDLEAHYAKVFSYVANNVILEEKIWDEYNYIIGQTLYTQKFTGETIYVLGEGEMTYDQFRHNFTILPSCFGEETLYNNKHWSMVQRVAVDDIKDHLSYSQVTITDIYPRR